MLLLLLLLLLLVIKAAAATAVTNAAATATATAATTVYAKTIIYRFTRLRHFLPNSYLDANRSLRIRLDDHETMVLSRGWP